MEDQEKIKIENAANWLLEISEKDMITTKTNFRIYEAAVALLKEHALKSLEVKNTN